MLELHNNVLDPPANGGLDCARNAEGKVLISSTALRYLLLPQLRGMIESHKHMCGCEVCLSIHSFLSTLIGYPSQVIWSQVIREAESDSNGSTTSSVICSATILPGDKSWHPKPQECPSRDPMS
jgi:hypothetical protein